MKILILIVLFGLLLGCEKRAGQPSNAEVISAIVADMNAEDNDTLANLKKDWDYATCINEAATRCGAGQDGSISFSWMNADGHGRRFYPDINECARAEKQYCEGRLQKITEFQYRASHLIFNVVKAVIYADSIIFDVDVKNKINNNIQRRRLTMQRKDKAWVLVNIEKVLPLDANAMFD